MQLLGCYLQLRIGGKGRYRSRSISYQLAKKLIVSSYQHLMFTFYLLLFTFY